MIKLKACMSTMGIDLLGCERVMEGLEVRFRDYSILKCQIFTRLMILGEVLRKEVMEKKRAGRRKRVRRCDLKEKRMYIFSKLAGFEMPIFS